MKIVVINANSDPEMTSFMSGAAKQFMDLHAGNDVEVIVTRTECAPAFISSFDDMVASLPGMKEQILKWDAEADAFVLSCACDPGLKFLRELTDKPVIGVGEASMYMAAQLGYNFSILQPDSYSAPNKRRVVKRYHMEDYLASISIADGDGTRYDRFLRAGQRALEKDNAEVLVLGCAGLSDVYGDLAAALNAPVLDCVLCGLAMAEAMARLNLKTSKIRYYSGGANG